MTTRTGLSHGFLVVSIPFDMQDSRQLNRHQRSIARASHELFYLLKQYDVPASFAVPDPACSHLTDAVLRWRWHELSLQMETSWSPMETTRRRFVQELAGRIQRAAAEGLDVRSVTCARNLPLRHPDVLKHHGIVACVASADGLPVFPRTNGPFPVRSGLWNIPIGLSWPGRSRWLVGPSARNARRAIHEAARHKSVLHISVNLPAMAVQTAVAMENHLRTLAGVMSLAHELIRQGQLVAGTLTSAAQWLSSQFAAVPTRSILAKAA